MQKPLFYYILSGIIASLLINVMNIRLIKNLTKKALYKKGLSLNFIGTLIFILRAIEQRYFHPYFIFILIVCRQCLIIFFNKLKSIQKNNCKLNYIVLK